MKNIIKKLIFIIPVVFVFLACEEMELLEEKPKAIASETFYNTPKEVASAANAMYDPYKSGNFENYWAYQECCVDYGFGRGSWASNSNFNGLDDTNISRTALIWNEIYLSIRNANLVIINTPNGSETSDAEKAQFIGEAKFVRAYNYFLLVRSWGGVPLRTENTFDQIEIPRSSIQDVYDLIIEDLEFAEDNLPDAPRLVGTPSKWTAKTLLADVYLNLENWTAARDLAKEVIQSGKYSLVSLSEPDDFYKIFDAGVVTSSEEIFYIKHHPEEGSFFGMFAHHPGSPYINKRGYYGHYTFDNNPVIAAWDANDFRRQAWFYPWLIGIAPNTLLYKKYIDLNASGNPSTDIPVYRYPDVLFIYAEAENFANNGPTADAVEYVNQVRRRAYGLDPKTSSSIDYKMSDYDKNSFFDLIIKERGYETFYECKRWKELVRTGKAEQIIKQVHGKDIAEKHYLFPIPVTETNYNKAIDPVNDQNPGY
jgi:hypothetical protein